MARTARTTVGITVFFDEQMPEEQILTVGSTICNWDEVQKVNYVPAAQAWENFETQYFEGIEELAEEFVDDNPLSGSVSYEIFLNELDDQDKVAKRLDVMGGVCKIRYSSAAIAGFASVGRVIGALSAAIIGVLLTVAVLLISSTISVTAPLRRCEDEIIRHIEITSYMTRAPSVAEGVLLGVLGAAVPLADIYFLYQRVVVYMNERYQMIAGLFQPIAPEETFPHMADTVGVLGIRIGFFVGFITIHRHLKV